MAPSNRNGGPRPTTRRAPIAPARPKASRAKAKTKTKLPAALARLTKRELALVIDEVVDTVNAKVRKSGLENEDAADLLFRQVFANESTSALSRRRGMNPAYRALRTRAGRTLKLDRYELREYVIIGALNQRFAATATGWDSLDWSVKLTLVSLVDPKDEKLDRLRKGIAFASRSGSTLSVVKAWKYRNYPPNPKKPGRPPGLTVAGGQKFVQTGLRLGNEEERQAFAERVKKAPATTQKAFAKDLEDMIENLKKLQEQLGTSLDP